MGSLSEKLSQSRFVLVIFLVLLAGCAEIIAPGAFYNFKTTNLDVVAEGAAGDSYGHMSGTIADAGLTSLGKKAIFLIPDSGSTIVRTDNSRVKLVSREGQKEKGKVIIFASDDSTLDWPQFVPGKRIAFDCKELEDKTFRLTNVVISDGQAISRNNRSVEDGKHNTAKPNQSSSSEKRAIENVSPSWKEEPDWKERREQAEQDEFNKAQDKNTFEAYNTFLGRYPCSKYTTLVKSAIYELEMFNKSASEKEKALFNLAEKLQDAIAGQLSITINNNDSNYHKVISLTTHSGNGELINAVYVVVDRKFLRPLPGFYTFKDGSTVLLSRSIKKEGLSSVESVTFTPNAGLTWIDKGIFNTLSQIPEKIFTKFFPDNKLEENFLQTCWRGEIAISPDDCDSFWTS